MAHHLDIVATSQDGEHHEDDEADENDEPQFGDHDSASATTACTM
jgi:hypothetical protein